MSDYDINRESINDTREAIAQQYAGRKTRQQKTGYYVTGASGEVFAINDHIWLSKPLAREIAREIGGWYEQGNRNTMKTVVIAR